MNQEQAQQLAQQIEQEEPRVKTLIQLSTSIGWQGWVVAVITRTTNRFLGEVESLSAWEHLKRDIQHHF